MRTFVLTIVFLAALGIQAALAASFCVVGSAIPPQCMYDDVSTCNGASSPPNTSCDVNPDAQLHYFGSQPYCAVRSDLSAQCIYTTRGECDGSGGGDAICIYRGEAPSGLDNPYRYDNRAQE